MNKSIYIKCFLKFGEQDHMLDLFENGTIYMNSIQFFRTLKDERLRSDRFEGVSNIRNYPSSKFEIKELKYYGEFISLQTFESYKDVIGNLYSLYCISSYHIPDPFSFRIDTKNLAFGKACVMIENNPEFLKRITNKLLEQGFKFRHNLVNYYDISKKNGSLTLFEKPKEYEFQNEYRFYVERQSTEPLIIKIGSLRDIAKLYKSKDIIHSLKMCPKHSI